MAKRKGSPTSREGTSSQRESGAKVDRDAREAEDAQRLDKLPQEVWEKILDELKSNDLFPLALSCRYFRQKQKELVARTGQNEPVSVKPRRVLQTNLQRKLKECQPVSAEYLQFCSKETSSLKTVYHWGRMTQSSADAWGIIRRLAAFHGHPILLKRLLRPSYAFSNEVIQELSMYAAKGGQLETLQLLKPKKGFELDRELFAWACRSGNLEVLKWLRSEGCPWGGRACEGAARGGHLEVLKWLRSEGCPWNAATCSGAASNGHLDVLKWVIDNGCPYEVNKYTNTALESLGLARATQSRPYKEAFTQK